MYLASLNQSPHTSLLPVMKGLILPIWVAGYDEFDFACIVLKKMFLSQTSEANTSEYLVESSENNFC